MWNKGGLGLLNVIICEDNEIERSRIESYIKNSIKNNRYDCKIVKVTHNPMEVVEFAKAHTEDTNVYFLDVDLNSDINGIEAARLIREVDINCYFIFITGHIELSMMTFQYKLKALDYLNKGDFPRLKVKIDECIKVVYEEYLKINDTNKAIGQIISIKSGSRHFNIQVRDILYFETIADHKIKVHTITNNIEYYGLMKDIIKLSEDDFYRVHKSYIVNLKHMSEVNYKDMYVRMDNGDYCNLARNYAKGLAKK